MFDPYNTKSAIMHSMCRPLCGLYPFDLLMQWVKTHCYKICARYADL
jgi:hypothetical protein